MYNAYSFSAKSPCVLFLRQKEIGWIPPGGPFFLIDTNQVSFWLEEKRGFIFLRPLNASSRNDVYSRMFQFCKTYIPGYWMSICFSVKLDRETQEITFFQDGTICSREKYIDGDFEWVFFNPSVSLEDM